MGIDLGSWNFKEKPTGLWRRVRNGCWAPIQRLLDGAEAAERFARSEHAHAKSAARLLRSMGKAYDGTEGDRLRMVADMPMIAFGGMGSFSDVVIHPVILRGLSGGRP